MGTSLLWVALAGGGSELFCVLCKFHFHLISWVVSVLGGVRSLRGENGSSAASQWDWGRG